MRVSNSRSRIWILSIGCALGLGLFAAQDQAQSRPRIDPVPEHVPGEMVVNFQDASRARMVSAISAIERKLGRGTVVNTRVLKTDSSTAVIRISRDADVGKAIEALKAEPSVQIAEPNFIYRIIRDNRDDRRDDSPVPVGGPNDPEFTKTWGLRNTGQTDAAGQIGKAGADINVMPLWQAGMTGSRKVVVAVIDTGIDWNHPDLKANLYSNPRESGANATNGRDDDGNGFIDDTHGWNFDTKTRESADDHNHGTHCAGTIGASGNNSMGVPGVNWEVSLMSIKFLDRNGGGSLDDAVEAINYATLMRVNVMSNSWGGGGFSENMKQSIERARAAGILFIAAAGNDSSNNDGTPSYPASYQVDNVVSVAATDNRDGLASFSNYGATTVHVAAPGVKVYSTIRNEKYEYMSGTSMATPHVAGIAALLLSANSSWNFSQVKDRMIRTSDPVRGLKKKVVAKGRINAYNAMHGIVPPSSEPDPSLWRSETQLVESEHPYKDSLDLTFKITRPGAKYIRVNFEKVETEARYDKVVVESGAGESVDEITGTAVNYLSEYVEGDTAIVRLKTDYSNTGYGFKVDKIQVIY